MPSSEAVTLDLRDLRLIIPLDALINAKAERAAPTPDDVRAAAAQPLGFAPPDLDSGETYAGLIVSADGRKQHHIVLLPGDIEANWTEATKWAESIGGDLPDRVEGALLFFTLRDQFQREAYWTNEQSAGYDQYAWSQHFHYGTQDITHETDQLRARAVRRVPIR